MSVSNGAANGPSQTTEPELKTPVGLLSISFFPLREIDGAVHTSEIDDRSSPRPPVDDEARDVRSRRQEAVVGQRVGGAADSRTAFAGSSPRPGVPPEPRPPMTETPGGDRDFDRAAEARSRRSKRRRRPSSPRPDARMLAETFTATFPADPVPPALPAKEPTAGRTVANSPAPTRPPPPPTDCAMTPCAPAPVVWMAP